MSKRTDCVIPYESFGIDNPRGTIHMYKYPHDQSLVGVQVWTGEGMFEGTFSDWRVAWREAHNMADQVLRK
jgi:hypothetical protein